MDFVNQNDQVMTSAHFPHSMRTKQSFTALRGDTTTNRFVSWRRSSGSVSFFPLVTKKRVFGQTDEFLGKMLFLGKVPPEAPHWRLASDSNRAGEATTKPDGRANAALHRTALSWHIAQNGLKRRVSFCRVARLQLSFRDRGIAATGSVPG